MSTDYVTTKTAAQYLGISEQLLEKWRLLRDGPPYVKLSRAVRYRRNDLDAFMAERLIKPLASNTGEG